MKFFFLQSFVRSVALAVVLLAFACLACATPQTLDLDFTDNARQRTIPLRIRVPEGSGKVPVVIFSHGLGGSRDGGRVWGEHWAAIGYFVIHTQHAGSDIKVLKTGLGAPLQRLKRAANGMQLIARAQDVKFVLDEAIRLQAQGDPQFSRIDLNRIAMAGHSFGAMTSLALAGQRYPNTTQTLGDPRIKAFLAFSPQIVQTFTRNDFDAYSNISRPMLVITGTIDGDMLGNGASPDKRSAVFDLLPSGDKYRVVFENGDHMVFGGDTNRMNEAFLQHIGNKSPRTDAATTALINNQLRIITQKFLDANLKGDGGAKSWLHQDAASALGNAGTWTKK